ncbi:MULTISPECIES: phosphocarrier protein HPr [Haloprofundus]|uniref:phosphocarrier protein HPr n=1 Tax=Haloprofundus TaxID=1911573 RepID=UPI000E440A15|nr:MULTISPECIES: phosphocarrier protein HPr [Haloprofundus]QCJ48241.1 HPr family phosphocarrier protein [Haloprofundus sp. MHR1]
MERTVTIVPEAGLHARPASKFVQTANEYDAEVTIEKIDGDGGPVNAASMLSVTSLNAAHGDEVRLAAEGDDAEAALDALEEILSTPEAGDDGDDGNDGDGE